MPEVSELLDNIGVQVEEIKSAPLKAEPSPFKPASPEAKAVVAGVIRDSFNWFVDIVAERRDMTRSAALALADGRIYTGRQALNAELIDEIGGEEEALVWLETQGVDKDLPVEDWRADDGVEDVFSLAAVALWLAEKIGLGPEFFGGGALERLLPESLKLDGLVSVWQGLGGEGG